MRVNFSWAASQNADGYRLYHNDSLIASVSGVSHSTELNLPDGPNRFGIEPFNQHGFGPKTEIVKTAPKAPGPVEGLDVRIVQNVVVGEPAVPPSESSSLPSYTATHYVLPWAEVTASSPTSDFDAQTATEYNNATTLANACTLKCALSNASAGDQVEIAPGTYVGQLPGFRNGAAFQPESGVSGTAANPIVFFAKNRATTIVDGSGVPIYVEGQTTEFRNGQTVRDNGEIGSCFGVTRPDDPTETEYFIWDGIYSSELRSNNKQSRDIGICQLFDAQNCEIRSCAFIGNPSDSGGSMYIGVFCWANSANCVITDCYFHQFRDAGDGDPTNSGGIITYDCQNCTIQNNTMYDCGCGFNIKGTTSGANNQYGWTIRYNDIDSCFFGMSVAWRLDTAPTEVYQNVVRNSRQSGMKEWSATGSEAFFVNLWVANNLFYNVTGTQAAGSFAVDTAYLNSYNRENNADPFTGTKNNFANNILLTSAGGAIGTQFSGRSEGDWAADLNFLQDNFYFGYSEFARSYSAPIEALTYSNWSTNYETTASNSDPQLNDPANQDYTLQGGSPAISKGTDILNLLGGGTSASINCGVHISGTSQTFGFRT